MTQSQCDVCYEFLDIKLFRFSRHCGHGLCVNCMEQFFRGSQERQPCPICRKAFAMRDVHQIFLNSLLDAPSSTSRTNSREDEDKDTMKRVSEAGARIGNKEVNRPEQSLAEVKEDIELLMKKQRNEAGFKAMHIVLSAFTKFIDRLLPAFARAKEEQRELVLARRALEERDAERDRLRRELDEANNLASSALDAAECAQGQLTREAEEHRKFVRESESVYRTEVAGKTKEVSELRKTLLGHKEKAAKQHKKIEELRGEVRRLEEVVADSRPREPIQWHEPSQSVSRAGEASSSNIVQTSDWFDTLFDEECDGDEEAEMDVILDSNDTPLSPLHNRRSTVHRLPQVIREKVVVGPRFETDWSLGAPRVRNGMARTNKKRQAEEEGAGVPVTRSNYFPLKMDSRGRVQGLVQKGPVTTKRVKC